MSSTLRPIVPKERKDARTTEPKRTTAPRGKTSPGRRAERARTPARRPQTTQSMGTKHPSRAAGRAGAAVTPKRQGASPRRQEANARRPRTAAGRPEATLRQRFWRSSRALSVAWISILIVLIIPALMQMYHQSVKLEDLQSQVSELSAQKAALEESISSLQTELSSVNTDAFIEKYAHEKLGMVKKNELVVEIDETSSSEESSNSAESNASSEDAPSEGKSGE
ncbi:MAG: septum formation initiator family protein [Ndongobacter sp.]|nr:septum formation initiator family protein [Ndongobacter sp.]